ncbi:MAG: hypothetical protein ACXVQR_03545 [Solirubrobacteraceae bacterium]
MWAYSLAALGSGGLLASLWLPWYTFRIPAAAINQAEQIGQQYGALGPLIRQAAEIARSLGPQHVTAWQVMHQADIFIAIAAAVAGCLALLVISGRAIGDGRLIATAGAVGLLVAAYRTFVPPGPSSLLHPAWGAWLAVASGALVVATGLLGAAAADEPEWTPPPLPSWGQAESPPEPPVGRTTSGSVAPPGA